MKKVYSKEELIFELQRFYRENQKVPVRIDMQNRLGYINSSIFVRYFGSWNNALETAGFKINQKHLSTTLSKDETYLIHELHRYVEEFGSVPRFDDLMSLTGFPSPMPYINTFGTWNDALNAAELPVNHYNRTLIGNEKCSICGKTKDRWRYDGKNVRYCPACFFKPDYRFGKLKVESSTGFGYVAQVVVRETLELPLECDCNTAHNFNSSIDLYDKLKYGKIDVKCSKLFYSKIWNNSYWSFNDNNVISNYYFLLGFSFDKQKIEHVWIINSKNEFTKKTTMVVANSDSGLEKRSIYEADARLYDNVYHNINWNEDLFLSKSPLENKLYD